MPPRSEADTRADLIDPILTQKGWTYPYVKREESGRAVELVNGKPRQRTQVYVDYTWRVEANTQSHPVAVALIEAKAENLPPDHGLEQAKAYTRCKRFNVPFIYATNGHQFVEYDRYTGITSKPRPMIEFPSRAEMRARYEAKISFSLDDPAARPLITPYFAGEATHHYYQDAAIHAVFEKIIHCRSD